MIEYSMPIYMRERERERERERDIRDPFSKTP